MKKKIFFSIILIFASLLCCFGSVKVARAEEQTSIESELENKTSGQLEDLDLSGFDELIVSLVDDSFDIFGKTNFQDKVKEILSGNFSGGITEIFQVIVTLIFAVVLKYIPLLSSILAIAIISSFLNSLKSGFAGKSTGDIIHFVLVGVIVILCANTLYELVELTTTTINNIKHLIDAIFPILFTLMTAMGGLVSVKVYQPAVAVLCSIVIQIITVVIIPLFSVSSIFNIVGNISPSIKLNKFVDFFNSISKWVIGLTFTIFMGFLSLQGITASTFDGISIKTAKFAVRSYVPILGGYLSEGFDLILTSSLLIKNSIGVAGLVLLIALIIKPVIQIAVLGLGFKLVSAIIEPIADSRISNIVSSIAKSLGMLIASILAVAFMLFITIILIILSSSGAV